MKNMITIFLGDTGEYLCEVATNYNQSAQLITSENKEIRNSGIYYTSIGEFTNEKDFLETLLACDIVYYSPPTR